MKITLRNKTQKTIRIDGKRFDAQRILRTFTERNGAENRHINNSVEAQECEDAVIIRDIRGNTTTILK